MWGYLFYWNQYMGVSIPEEEYPRLEQRAREQLARYKRIYTVTAPEENSEKMAICAMADALYYFETMANTPQSVSIGSVSSSKGSAVDLSPRAQSAALYRCAALYLGIYRGCR